MMSSLLILFFDSFITAFLVFVGLYFLFTFFRVDVIAAIIPVVVIFLISFIRKIRQNRIKEIEKNYPDLKEMLRTSRDYQNKQNSVTLALHTQVINKVNKVDINSLLDPNRLFWKFLIISIVLFSTIALSATGVHFFDVSNAISSSPIIGRIRDSGKKFINDNLNFLIKEDYLEDPDISELGDDEVNLSLDIFSTELDINDISDPEENDFGGDYPDSIGGIAQDTYTDKIPEEHKETIKDYFEKINE